MRVAESQNYFSQRSKYFFISSTMFMRIYTHLSVKVTQKSTAFSFAQFVLRTRVVETMHSSPLMYNSTRVYKSLLSHVVLTSLGNNQNI